VASGNAGTFANGQSKNPSGSTENYVVPLSAVAGTQICRRIYFEPENENGGNDVSTQRCATVQGNYSLDPSINIQITAPGGAAVPGNVAEVGDTITFVYAVNNNAAGATTGTNCNIVGLSRAWYYTPPTPEDSTSDPGYAPPPGVPGCPRNFPGNTNTALGSESVTATDSRSICRTLFVNPATPGATEPLGEEVCAYVTRKPYARVYGGDVAAGGGYESSPGVCTQNAGAAVIGWNQGASGAGGAYAGAGGQFATFALNAIFDAATSLGNGGGASPPVGVSFSNTTGVNVSGGQFGGNYGSAPCNTDYYARRPTAASAPQSNVGNLATGSYSMTGPLAISGTIGSGFGGAPQRVVLYVDGHVLIDGDITYPASWNTNNPPLFMLVAKGDIFINRTVQRIDGLIIAQPLDNGSQGRIFTCAVPGTLPPVAHTAPNIGNFCNTKLTVNGGFVARQIQLQRTFHSRNQATVAGDTHAAEVFNYGPAMWMVRPPDAPIGTDYDAITTLPPIL
jgi:hypothetical protein